MNPKQSLSLPRSTGAGELTSSEQLSVLSRGRVVIMLRWVLIIATSYLVLFSRPLAETPPSAALFVALYLASNVILSQLVPRLSARSSLDWTVVVLDIVAVAAAMALTNHANSEFFVVYFVVLFLSALTERVGLVALATLLITTTYLYTLSQFVNVSELIDQGYMLRIPFLFAVALFFGHVVQNARAHERAAEEARARALRMELLSAVSHDLKNPLGVIQSLASLMLDGDAGALNAQQTDLTQRIHASARQVNTLALNLIDAERIEAGRLVPQPQLVNLASVVENALLSGRSASQLKGIALRCVVEPELPHAYIDAVQTERVVSNLLANAIKFTPTGGVIEVSVRYRDGRVVLTVSDTGRGIAASELPHVFDKYHREGTNHRIEGSGLGLFIVKAIVQSQGGNVRIDSALGKGTTVTVSLPTSSAKQPAAAVHRVSSMGGLRYAS